MRDDVTTYAERLRADEVPVERAVIAGAGHADLLRADSAVIVALAAALTGPRLANASQPSEPIREPHRREGTPS